MRILLISALFPPDVASPAPYVKELAARLANDHSVTVLTYGRLPESVAGATVTAVPKATSAPTRLWRFTHALWRASADVEAVIVNNAPATELPLILVSLVRRRRWLLLKSDTKIKYAGWRAWLHRLAGWRATEVQAPLPKARPEVLSFTETNEADWQRYEDSWEQHQAALTHYIYGHAN